jgi:hypothetical protein
MKAVLPFSRQGVMRAKSVSPFVNRIPPLNGFISHPDGKAPLVDNWLISMLLDTWFFANVRLGLRKA